jgi:diacylglycerol O-acyltransferase / wax synthase
MTDRIEAHVHETDAFTIRMERDPQLRSTITAVAVFDQAPDWSTLVDRIDRATRLVPSFRALIAPSPLGLAPPRWIPDPDFDLSWHLRRVETPDHHTAARAPATTAFDPARPLWEFTLFDGLADGRSALVMKVHHVLTDGIGGIQLAAHVVDLERTPRDLGPLPPVPPAPGHWPANGLTDVVGFTLTRWTRTARSLATALPGGVARSVRQPADSIASAAATGMSLARFVRPMTTTMSPVMTRRSMRRHFDRLDVPLAGLKSAGKAGGASMNDVFLASLTGGLRRYHEHHGTSVRKLRVTLPISTRQEGDPVAGNRITLARFEVPVDVVDPMQRMAAIGETVRQMREEPALLHGESIASVFNLLPPSVTGGMLKHVDLVAANVPGFPTPIYVGGALVEAFYPFAPTIGAAVNVALISYCETCNIGISTDAAAVPDHDVFRHCMADGFAEVVDAGRVD